MDTLTQMALGATFGIAAVRHVPIRAVVIGGAVFATIPDLDVVSGLWGDSFSGLETHRAATHSLVFAPLVAWPAGWLGWRAHRWWLQGREADRALQAAGTRRAMWSWILLAFLAMWTHPLLDACTSYGTMLLWPFSRERVAWDAVAIVDPLYTLPLLLVVWGSWTRRVAGLSARVAASSALLLTTGYLLAGVALAGQAERTVRAALPEVAPPEARGEWLAENASMRTLPTLGNLLLWRVLIREDEGVIGVTHVSLLTGRVFGYERWISPEDARIQVIRADRRGETVEWFLGGWGAWTIEADGELRWHDLRYGVPGKEGSSLWGGRFEVLDGQVVEAEWERWGMDAVGPRAIGRQGRMIVE